MLTTVRGDEMTGESFERSRSSRREPAVVRREENGLEMRRKKPVSHGWRVLRLRKVEIKEGSAVRIRGLRLGGVGTGWRKRWCKDEMIEQRALSVVVMIRNVRSNNLVDGNLGGDGDGVLGTGDGVARRSRPKRFVDLLGELVAAGGRPICDAEGVLD
jgi:hypothetical protein